MVKNIFKAFKKKKKEAEKVTKIIDDPEEIDRLKEAELGRVKAERDVLKKELGKVKKEKESVERVNVSKELALQKQELFNNRYRKAFSLRQFFFQEFQGKRHSVMSFDFKKNFGPFYDFLILTDGQLSLWMWNQSIKKPEQVITGSKVKDLLRHFRGLTDTVNKGFFVTNLDSEGGYVEDIMEREIPRTITNRQGKIELSKINSEELYKIVSEKDEQISELISEQETYEEAVRQLTEEKNRLVSQAKMNRERAVTAETQHLADWGRMKEIHKGYRDLVDENANFSQQLMISEKEKKNLEKIRKHLTASIKEVYSKTDKALAQEDMNDAINNVMRYVGPILTEKFSQPKTVAPPPSRIIVKTEKQKTPMDKKFEDGEEDDDEEMD